MTVFEKISHLQKVWRVALPHLAEPGAQDAVRWAPYSLEVVEMAILHAGRRFAEARIPADFNATDAFRYTTATARKMTERRAASTAPAHA